MLLVTKQDTLRDYSSIADRVGTLAAMLRRDQCVVPCLAVSDLLAAPDAAFKDAVSRILANNHELYRRLA